MKELNTKIPIFFIKIKFSVPQGLLDLILKLLRRIKKTVKHDKWEKSLVGVIHTISSIDAWEVERFGYKKAKLTSKVFVLKVMYCYFNKHKIVSTLLCSHLWKCSLITT